MSRAYLDALAEAEKKAEEISALRHAGRHKEDIVKGWRHLVTTHGIDEANAALLRSLKGARALTRFEARRAPPQRLGPDWEALCAQVPRWEKLARDADEQTPAGDGGNT